MENIEKLSPQDLASTINTAQTTEDLEQLSGMLHPYSYYNNKAIYEQEIKIMKAIACNKVATSKMLSECILRLNYIAINSKDQRIAEEVVFTLVTISFQSKIQSVQTECEKATDDIYEVYPTILTNKSTATKSTVRKSATRNLTNVERLALQEISSGNANGKGRS